MYLSIAFITYCPLFNNNDRYRPSSLVDGPRNDGDPLTNIFKLGNVGEFYQQADPPAVPMILSPSHMKIVYASPFKDFWDGLGKSGAFNLGLSIIGFSLPEHDDYIKISLFKMVTNYQDINWEEKILDTIKDNVKLIDFRESEEAINDLLSRYRFIDDSKLESFTDGFSSEAVTFLFNNKRNY